MKFTKDTISILQNFAQINPSILFRNGNVIRTMAVSKAIVAKANVEESFDKSFGIYELSKFLGVMSLFEEPVVEFGEKDLLVKQGAQKIKYTYADESLIIAPKDKDLPMPSEDVTFKLPGQHLTTLVKAFSMLSAPDFAIVGENGELSVRALNHKIPHADSYSVAVGETDKSFQMLIKAENVKFLTSDYDVTVSSKGVVQLVGEKVTYWVVTEADSKFED